MKTNWSPFHTLIVVFILSFSPFSLKAGDSKYKFDQGVVELIAGSQEIGLYFEMIPEWHIYWKNPGDSGAAPRWELKGLNSSIKATHWPTPKRIPVEDLVNFGYEKSALFRIVTQNPMSANTAIQMSLEFLICKVECIPYFADLTTIVNPDIQGERLKALALNFNYPELSPPVDFRWTAQNASEGVYRSKMTLPFSASTLEIFPMSEMGYQTTAPHVIPESKYFDVEMAVTPSFSYASAAQDSFLVLGQNKADSTPFAFYAPIEKPKSSFALILIWAFLGGLILNLMPCVFPVLSMKLLSLAQGAQSPSKNLEQSLMYTLGVLISFVALGGVLVFLRSIGQQIGWGFQLQSPTIIAAMSILFFWVGANFLGAFEMATRLMSLGNFRDTGNERLNSFFTGVLACLVASPCTAPFMGAALGAAMTLDPSQTILVFFGLGLGMASPFLAIGFSPKALAWLPKPGAWMVTFKEALSWPLFLTSIWLLWVLAQQVGYLGVIGMLICITLSAFFIWLHAHFKSEKAQSRVLILGFTLALALGWAWVTTLSDASMAQSQPTTSNWEAFDPKRVEASRLAGDAVFIDFTAAWCITCQVNKRRVLDTQDIELLFAKHAVKLFRADWTNRDPVITQALAEYGRNSLPLYVFYPAGEKNPQLLPEILSKSMIEQLFLSEEVER